MNMTKSMKTIFSTVAVCTAITFASIATVNASDEGVEAVSSHQQEHKHRGHRNEMKRMAKFLSLSEDQKVKINAIKTKSRDQHQPLNASMKAFKIAEKNLLTAKTFDEKAFSSLQSEYQPTLTKLALIRAKSKQALFNVLNKEQQDKWLKMMEGHRGDKKGHGKKHSDKHGKKMQD
jgi:Spy/CpxP family protein refolding chaperone